MGSVLSYFAETDLESTVNSLSVNTVLIGSVLLVACVLMAILFANKIPRIKAPLFVMIVIIVLGTTFTISGATVYLNTKSYTGGPVHWHADFEVWACGNEMELRDPSGFLSNKIGTPTYHEHNDKRIHLEGVPVTPHDASLGKFMDVVGGSLSKDTLVVPLNDEKLFENGEDEEDGDGSGAQAPEQIEQYIRTNEKGKFASFVSGNGCGSETAEVQVYVYKFDRDSKTYTQTKLDNPADYTISHYSDVPPGDCIIMEFGPRRDRTDKLCEQYGIRGVDTCAEFGVAPDQRKVCEYREVR